MQKFQTDLETGEMQFEIEEELAAEEEMEEAELFDHRLSKAIH